MAKLGLVLSGGGSKGAYEIGVYIALKKLKKNVDFELTLSCIMKIRKGSEAYGTDNKTSKRKV